MASLIKYTLREKSDAATAYSTYKSNQLFIFKYC